MSKTIVRFVPALFGIALLAGCTSADPGLGLDPGQQSAVDAATNSAVVQGACPKVEMREGTAFYRTYVKGGDGDPSKVIHQASLADTTRQCRISGDQVIMTVVAAGRLVSGPAAKAGQVELPIRVAVLDGDTVLYSELQKQPVVLTDSAPTAQFVFTNSTVTFPAANSRSAKVLIGFDPGPYNTP